MLLGDCVCGLLTVGLKQPRPWLAAPGPGAHPACGPRSKPGPETRRRCLFNEANRAFHGQDASLSPAGQWARHYGLFEGDGLSPLATVQVPLYRAWTSETLRDVEIVIRPS